MYPLGCADNIPYHPQANGVGERGNRDLGDMLRSMLLGKDEEDWDLLLP